MELVKSTYDKVYSIEYQSTKIGDLVYDKNTNSVYEATIMDADNMNWIVKDTYLLKANK